MSDLGDALDAVRRVLDETEAEYAQMPLVVRLLVRRGFGKRTGRDFAAWRALLATGRSSQLPAPAELPAALDALVEHYRGAPERARRGRGATDAQLEMITQRSRARVDIVLALRALLG